MIEGSRPHKETAETKKLHECALAGGISTAQGVSLGYQNTIAYQPSKKATVSVAPLGLQRSKWIVYPGLTPGATFYRHVRRLIDRPFSASQNYCHGITKT